MAKSATRKIVDKLLEIEERQNAHEEVLIDVDAAVAEMLMNQNVIEESIRNRSPRLDPVTDYDSSQWMAMVRKDNRAARNDRNRYILKLGRANQSPTEVCPCGQHAGIRFEDADTGEVLEENVCPARWWLSRHRLAVLSGDRNFLKENPFEEFIGWYNKGA